MRAEELDAIAHKMEAAIRGYTLTTEEARQLAVRFLRIMEQSICPIPIKVDPALPAGTVEFRYGGMVAGRITGLAPD